MSRLQGKVAIVTGGATGLGKAIATLYAEEGARVVVCDIREPEGEQTVQAIRSAGGTATFTRVDVANAAEMQSAVDTAEREFGALHVMTANAGILGRGTGKSLVDMSEAEIAEIMSVNWLGVCLSFKLAVPAIRRSGGGAMTTTASVAAHRGRAKLPVYCASKGAVVALVRSLALDLAPQIRVNAVSAGSIETEIGVHAAQARGVDPADFETGGARVKPFGQADPREVAYAHLFLASDEASYVNGQALMVDGGKSVATP